MNFYCCQQLLTLPMNLNGNSGGFTFKKCPSGGISLDTAKLLGQPSRTIRCEWGGG